MSIKGIDSQIMIARSTDFARDTSALQKKPEITQDYLAVRERIQDAQDQSRVAKTLDSQKPELHPDEGDGGGAGYGAGSGAGSGKRGAKGENDEDMLVPPGNNVIDIRV